jgi:hypothetical protein
MKFPNILRKVSHVFKAAANTAGSVIRPARVVDLPGVDPFTVVPSFLGHALAQAGATALGDAKEVRAGQAPMGMGAAARGSVPVPPGNGVVAVSTDQRTGVIQWHIPAPGEVAKEVSVWVHRAAETARKVGVFQIPGAREAAVDALGEAERVFKNGVGLKSLPPQSLNPHATRPPADLPAWAGLPAMIVHHDHVLTGSIGPGRALLVIHGIIDRVYGFALSPLLVWGDLLETLQVMYGHRVYAFDHLTLSETPEQNATQLLEQIPDGVELDILCHSRGGLVTRCLLRKLQARPRITVKNVVFMAAANQGSPLAAHENLADMLTVLSTLGARLPAAGVVLDAAGRVMVRVAHLLAWGIEWVPGLQTLVPDGPLIRGLNTGPATAVKRYSFIRANLNATTEPVLKQLEMVSDRGFKGILSDLVVPFDGVVDLGSHTPRLSEDAELTTVLGTSSKAQGQWHHLNLLDSPAVRAFILKQLRSA